MHAHHREVVAALPKNELEGRRVGLGRIRLGGADLLEHLAGPFKEAEDSLGIPEDVPRTEEANHAPPHGHDGGLGADRGACALAVRELLARADRPEGHVVGDNHADGALDLLGRGPEHGAERRRRRDRSVQHMVDLVALEREHLGEASANFIQQDHAPQGKGPIHAGHLGRGDRNRIEVIVSKLAGGVPELGIEAEVRSVGIPLADCVGVGDDRLLRLHKHV